MERKISNKQLTVYMIAAYGLAWIIQVIASYFANWGNEGGNTLLFQVMLMLCMYMPFAATLIAKIPLKGLGFSIHLKGKIRYIFITLWLPLLLNIAGAAVYFLVFPNRFDPEFTMLQNSVDPKVLDTLSAQGISIHVLVLISLLQAITWAPFINALFALGEEIGWRGVLYPALKERLGKTKGRIVGGICWGAWHWPVMLLAGYEYGKDYIGSPFLGLATFCLFTTVFGIFCDWVYEKTSTIWMPSLLHGAINALTIFIYLEKPEYADQLILGPAPHGLISIIPAVLLAVLICSRHSNTKEPGLQ